MKKRKKSVGSEVPTQQDHVPDEKTRKEHLEIAGELAGMLLESCEKWLNGHHPDLEDRFAATICSIAFMKCLAIVAAQYLNVDEIDLYVEHYKEALKEHILNTMEILASEECQCPSQT